MGNITAGSQKQWIGDGQGSGQSKTDGMVIGQSGGYISFYGGTPAAQRTGAAQGTYTTTMTSTTPWGWSTSTAADAASALLTEIRAVLVALNLMKGSA